MFIKFVKCFGPKRKQKKIYTYMNQENIIELWMMEIVVQLPKLQQI